MDKDPNKAVPLFWAVINRGDRVDSALKDMALVMKQLNRAEEAIEAVRSFRGLCSFDAQEPLDNVLLDLYKKCGMIEEQIELMNFKLKMIDEGLAFGGRSTKLAKSQGIKHQVTINQERAKLLGNLAWAYMQAQRYKEAEPIYWQALDIEPDYNKQCNLAICLMQTGRFAEAKTLLRVVPYPSTNCNAECYIKSFERAWEMLKEFESQPAPSDERKEDTVHRITNPPFINPSLSNDTLSPSPPIYFSPQSDLKRRRSICEFRPPLSVNHNRRYMNGDRGGQNNKTVKVKEYSVEAHKLKPSTSPELSVDAKAKERFCTPSAIPKGRRTWADIAEEEEQEEELANNESDNSGDENVGLDIPHSNHHDLKSQDFTKKFSQKLDLVDQKKSEGSKTPRTGASSARRALSFIELSPGGNGMYSKQSLKMRYRMQVLKDITLDSNSEV